MAKQFYVCQVTVATVDGEPRVAWLPEADPVVAKDAQEALAICAAEGDMRPGAAIAVEVADVTTASLDSPGLQVNVDPPPPPILPA